MQKITNRFKHRIQRNMQQRLMNLSISAKIVTYYLILLVISIGISAALYSRVNSAIALGPVSNISYQLLHTVSTSTNTVIENVAEFSKLIVSNDEIQDSLRNTLINYSFAYQHRPMWRWTGW